MAASPLEDEARDIMTWRRPRSISLSERREADLFFADLMGRPPEHPVEETPAPHATTELFFAELTGLPVQRWSPARARADFEEDEIFAEDADDLESDGRSADSALNWHFDEPGLDPEASSDSSKEVSQVWISSDNLRRILDKKGSPNDAERTQLKGALVYQLSTVVLYWQMRMFFRARESGEAAGKTVSLYILLFPGEAKDNTGIKDLNDKVIGQWWNAQFIKKRQEAIGNIFGARGSKFMVAAQTYKTAYILTYEQTRKDFAGKLAELDEQLRLILLKILDAAEGDATSEQRAEIQKLRKKLKKKNYRFDIFFGLRTLTPKGGSPLENVYLLVTEALKGAAIARYIAKTQSLGTRVARKFVTKIDPDKRKLDARGKEYEWSVFLKASVMAQKIKDLFVGGYTADVPYQLEETYVDTVWTLSFLPRKNLWWGNPDVIRDVRKKKLEAAPLKEGNMHYSFPIQKDLLELWLVVLNMLDFVKRFEFAEFRKEVQRYHDDVLEVFTQVGTPSKTIDWTKLERVLTHDVRQTRRIAEFESASEFLFYSFAADHQRRIFFSFDVRDMGVELMLHYEQSNRAAVHNKYSDIDLMEETFRASDAIDARRRLTYDAVVDVFKKYYDLLKQVGRGRAAVSTQRAFGPCAIGKLGSFAESVQIMLGGDEIYAAAHPLYAMYVASIISDLDKWQYGTRTIDLRASVAFSGVDDKDAQNRREIQLSHQQAMRLAEEAPGTLKRLERTHRRIERLIDVIEKNDKKKGRGPGYRNELTSLALMKLFARVKHGRPKRIADKDARTLLDAFRRGDIGGALRTKNFELVDFNGSVIDVDALEKKAAALEDKVRRDVGFDNVRVQVPPAHKIPLKLPKWLEELIDIWA